MQSDLYKGEMIHNRNRVIALERAIEELPQRKPGIYLNLGCGEKPISGFLNIDKYIKKEKVDNYDICDLPFDENFADVIISYHSLEHLPIRYGRKALRDWYKILKDRGKLYLEVPDLEEIVKGLFNPENNNRQHDWFLYCLYGWQVCTEDRGFDLNYDLDPGQFHCNGFSEKFALEELFKAGFIVNKVIRYDGYNTPSIFIEAEKIVYSKPFNLKYTGERVIPTESSVANKENLMRHANLYEEFLGLLKGRKVLDAACGCGFGTELIAEYASEVSGIDKDVETIKYAQYYFGRDNIEYHHGECTQLPFQDSSFDVVLSVGTFEQIKDVSLFIKEAHRVLRPTGLFLFTTPDGILFPYDGTDPKNRRGYHFKHYTKYELSDLLSEFFCFRIYGTDFNFKKSEEEKKLVTEQYSVICQKY